MKRELIMFLAFVCLLACSTSAKMTAEKNQSKKSVKREIAITFDDLPATHGDLKKMTEITTKLLARIKANKIPTIGFVNEFKLQPEAESARRAALLKMWTDRGLELGNHTFSHIAIDQTPIEDYKRDVIRGETVTKQLLAARGKKLRYFRHTQLRTGPTPEYKKALDDFLAARGYTVAPVTIDNNDFIFADVYARTKAQGHNETAKRVADAYIPYMEEVFDHFEKLSLEFLGYEVKQTLLLHANEINADYFDELVQMMKRRGYAFISLEDALKDRAYSLADAQVKMGYSWIHRWMIAKGLSVKMEPREPQFVAELFTAYRNR